MQIFDPRQSMMETEFEIFHYKDAKFEGVPVHQHDFYEVYFFISGNVEYNVEGKSYHLKQGDILLINPLELHQPRIRPDQSIYERIVLWIDKSYLSLLCSNESSLTRCFDNTNPNHSNLLSLTKSQQNFLHEKLIDLLRESEEKGYGSDIAKKAILTMFLVELNRISMSAEISKEGEKSDSPLVSGVLDYINSHYCEKLSLSSIADEFFVSKYYLCRAFKKHTGLTVQQYIKEKRLSYFEDLRKEGRLLTECASLAGFHDYSAFYRGYVKKYGHSPEHKT